MGKTSLVAGIALAVGLESLGKLLGVGNKHQRSQGVQIRLFTDYEPLHDEFQRRRWKQYGTPSKPSPDHRRLEKQLINWTLWVGNNCIQIHKLNDGEIKNTKIVQCLQGWIAREQKVKDHLQSEVKTWALPMSQEEVKNCLSSRQDQDEAKAIAWLAEKPDEKSVAGRISCPGHR